MVPDTFGKMIVSLTNILNVSVAKLQAKIINNDGYYVLVKRKKGNLTIEQQRI
jgi:hypothetical protein